MARADRGSLLLTAGLVGISIVKYEQTERSAKCNLCADWAFDLVLARN